MRYISQIVMILGKKGMSRSLLLDRLLNWSRANETDLLAYDENMRGRITSTRNNSAGMRYIDFAVGLGLVTQTTDLYRCTRYGWVAREIALERNLSLNAFIPSKAEKLLFLYLLIERDADVLLTIMQMIHTRRANRLAPLQKGFKQHYLLRIQQKIQSVADERAQRLLLDRRREIERWGERGSPERYAEHIVPPRLHWLYDLGLIEIRRFRTNIFYLSEVGKSFYLGLPRLQNTNTADVSSDWIKGNLIETACKALFQDTSFQLIRSNGSLADIIKEYLREAFKVFRTGSIPKVSLYPALLFLSLKLAATEGILANISDLEQWLSFHGPPNFEIRISARENESYIVQR